MANSDLKLEDNGMVRVEGDVLRVEAHDIFLDNASRRSNQNKPFRRALVHDPGDGLTLNWDHDYPGGVTIKGPTAADKDFFLNGRFVVCIKKVSGVHFGGGPGGAAGSLAGAAAASIQDLAAAEFGGNANDYDVMDVFTDMRSLQAQVATLQAQVAALKAKLGMP
jgi:hypothetical protein